MLKCCTVRRLSECIDRYDIIICGVLLAQRWMIVEQVRLQSTACGDITQ
jgi:hypothetical protein